MCECVSGRESVGAAQKFLRSDVGFRSFRDSVQATPERKLLVEEYGGCASSGSRRTRTSTGYMCVSLSRQFRIFVLNWYLFNF